MKLVILNMKEQLKYDIIKKVKDGKLSKNSAQIRLGVSRRTIDRLLITYTNKGKAGFQHGNHGSKPANAYSPETIQKVIDLYQTKYYDTSFKHFHEFLVSTEKINVSYSFVFKTLTNAHILSLKPTRAKRKIIKKELEVINFAKNNPNNTLEQTIQSPKIISSDNAHPRREAAKYSGELVQMDASDHHWFGSDLPKAHLHAAIDDASKTILALYFDTQETLNGYFNIFDDILKKHGIPELFFTDKRTVFTYERKNGKVNDGQDPLTQFSYACKTLGTRIYTSSVPEHKARVERLFQTLQHRLIPVLRLRNITTIEEANTFLKEEYIPEHNKMFANDINDYPNGFAQVDESINLELILARRSKRKIDNGSCISYNNVYYYPVNETKTVTFKAKTQVTVIDSPLTNNKFIEFDGKVYSAVRLHRNKSTSKTLDSEIELEKVGTFPVSKEHPHKRASFERMQAKKLRKRKAL
jgi:transposase